MHFTTVTPVFRFMQRPWYRRWWYSFLMWVGRGPIFETPGLAFARQTTGRVRRICKVINAYEVEVK